MLFSGPFSSSWLTAFAVSMVWVMFLWVLFLIVNMRKRSEKPSFVSCLKMFGHMWLAVLVYIASKVADDHHDPVLVLFVFFVIFRYYKTVINLWYWIQYKPAVAPNDFDLSPRDCTVIVPTVGPDGNESFIDMLTAILYNQPSQLIISTVTDIAEQKVKSAIKQIIDDLVSGTSKYQMDRNLGIRKLLTQIQVINSNVSNKRAQVVDALQAANVNVTSFTVFVDDSAVWTPTLLAATLPAFAQKGVGFVGTRKWVKRLPRTYDSSLSWIHNAWNNYRKGFWNTVGALYLLRHNFEAQATNAADGGVFCVSGRTSLIRSDIVQDPLFQHEFTNEYIVPWLFGGFGPVVADDDNFITRWVINRGWSVKFQSTAEATMTTVIGKEGGTRFLQQCVRWSRTTFRQNPVALFADLAVWWKWPITVWTTYFPWLYNAALIWDSAMLITLLNTELYNESQHRGVMVSALVGTIWASKLIKTAPWFLMYPRDFFLYFFPIPAVPLFAYGHSILKVYTAFTFWDLKWSGRKLPNPVTSEKKTG